MIHILTNRILPPGADPGAAQTRARVGKRCGALGIFANAVLFGSKLAIGMISGSVSITADAMNNLADASSSVVTLLGFKLAQQPADEDHPFGHARYEYLSGLAVALLILLIGFELAKSSFLKILHPEQVLFSGALVLVLCLSILGKLLLFAVNREMGLAIGSGALLATAADSRNDCITTGAVLISALAEHFLQVKIDGWAGLAVALFILYSGWNMARDTISPLLGENATPELKMQILSCLRLSEKILGYHDLMVHDYGPGQRFASVHVEMDMKEDPLVCHDIIDEVERHCLDTHKIHLVIHYDPIVTDDAELNEMRREVELVLQSIDERIGFHDFRLVRGDTHTNLIFDVTLPPSLSGSEKQIKRQLDTAINLNSKTRYYTVITFDNPGFNEAGLWEN
ncbi:MAG: cation transporter [Oscillospiraceae bacterium]|nr:cation transporter [Oscillospiraceae bacterium]